MFSGSWFTSPTLLFGRQSTVYPLYIKGQQLKLSSLLFFTLTSILSFHITKWRDIIFPFCLHCVYFSHFLPPANPHPLSTFPAPSSRLCVCTDLLYFSGGSDECRDRDAEIMRAVCRRAGHSRYDCPFSRSPCCLTLSLPTESSEF